MVVFHDLCLSVSDTNKSQLKHVLDCAGKLGYNTVAVEHICTELTNTSPPLAPPSVEHNVEGTKVKQLSRLTLILSEVPQSNKLKTSLLHSYDIFAVRPTNAKMFHAACNDLEVDVISFKMDEKLPCILKAHPVSVALSRGIHFEISYSPTMRDSSVRRYVLSNAINVTRSCRGRNIIISSTATNPMELRGPYDVANIGILFGMNENQAKDAVQSNCRAVLMHAVARKSIRSTMDLHQIKELPAEDLWKVKAGQQACGMEEEDEEEEEERPGSRKKKKRKNKGGGGSGVVSKKMKKNR